MTSITSGSRQTRTSRTLLPLRLLILAFAVGCGGRVLERNGPSQFELVDLDQTLGVIVPPEYAETHWEQGLFYGVAQHQGFWHVTPADVRRAFDASRAHVEALHSAAHEPRSPGEPPLRPQDLRDLDEIVARLDAYDAQFLGYVDGGRRRILCNFFADETAHAYWRAAWVGVDGGGAAYWTTFYDVDDERCCDFFANASM